MLRVAYLGPKGTFSEEVAQKFFQDESTELFMFESIQDVLEAVNNEVVDKCIVPIENSIAGNIHMTVDGLLLYNLNIEDDLIFTVSLHLIGNSESEIDKIDTVISIAPAINQCRQYIKKNAFNVEYTDSTAKAALSIKESSALGKASIASRKVAEEYGLKIFHEEVQDYAVNHTRFIVVSKQTTPNIEQKKTMMLVTPNNEFPGVLSSILNVFSALAINLSWIESRPTGEKLGTYRFLIETEIGVSDQRMIKAINIINTFGHHVHIVGSYATTIL